MMYRVSLDFSDRDLDAFLTLLINNPERAYSQLTASVFNLIEPDDYPICDVSYKLIDEFPLEGDYDKDLDSFVELEGLICAYARVRNILAHYFNVDLDNFAEGVPLGQEEGDEDA